MLALRRAVYNDSSIETDILSLIIEAATDKPLAEYIEGQVWWKMGAEKDAGFATDGAGFPLAQGGLSMTLPDVARSSGEPIVPPAKRSLNALQ